MYDTKNELLLNSLMNYFENEINMTTLVEVLQDRSLASLRMIDWFVTKYAKQYNTSYIIDNKSFNVYMNYKSQLKAYSKKQMDPFCRRERFVLKKHANEIITTIGQMNFFRWAIENRVIKFLYENYDDISKLMKQDNKTNKTNKTNKQSLSRKKGHHAISNKKSFTREKNHTILHFD